MTCLVVFNLLSSSISLTICTASRRILLRTSPHPLVPTQHLAPLPGCRAGRLSWPKGRCYKPFFDVPAPILREYPLETSVPEKTEAIVSLGITNSRMKGFYDLRMIVHALAFEGNNLAEAIRRTFKQRRTPLSEQVHVDLLRFQERLNRFGIPKGLEL